MKTIGFIGVGVMGKPMVRNLMKKGFPVSIYTRTKSKVLDVIEEGAVWCDDVKTCVQDKDVIITIVGYPKDVEEVYFGENGIIANAKPGAISPATILGALLVICQLPAAPLLMLARMVSTSRPVRRA